MPKVTPMIFFIRDAQRSTLGQQLPIKAKFPACPELAEGPAPYRIIRGLKENRPLSSFYIYSSQIL